MSNILKSRKFWATVVALALLLLGPRAGVDGEVLKEAVYTLIAYIIGTGLSDIRAQA